MSSSTHHHHHHHKKSKRPITFAVHPTLGKPFTITCSPQLTVENLKEDISDRLGISPKKMSVLFQARELTEGTLLENSVEDGSELRLVPMLESGTSISMDPMAMMKHSMSGISDQQIDEFLAGKSPLSVAIRLGESVVVVNLNRAKVEEVDIDSPPPVKHVCSRSHPRRTSDDISTSHPPPPPPPPPPSTTTVVPTAAGVSTAPLNSNPHWTTPPSSLSTVAAPCSTATPTIGSRHPTQTLSAAPAPPPSIPSPSSSTLPPPEQACSHRHLPKRDPMKTSHSKSGSKVQLTQEQWEELRRLQETPVSDSGISMKRKAVMEAIGEILKKMYTQRAKGKIPGSFKGRFSSEFTCDGDMREIIHSRTTMTSYGDGEAALSSRGSIERAGAGGAAGDGPVLTQSKLKENEALRNKVAMLKWKMQHCRAERKAKRKRSDKPSPCGWMEAIDCDISTPPPKIRRKTGVCGFKRGFLLAD